MKPNNKALLYLRIFTTFFFLILLLVVINNRVDLQPNRITVIAESPQGYSSPKIILDKDSSGVAANSGQTLPESLFHFKTLEIKFEKEPLVRSEKFILSELSFNESSRSSAWLSAIPANALISSNTESLLILSRCPNILLRFFIGENEWQVEPHDQFQNSFIIKNSAFHPIGKDSIQIHIRQPQDNQISDLRTFEFCVRDIFAIDPDQTIKISGFIFDKHFGKLDITLPYTTWSSTQIFQHLIPIDEEGNTKFDDGILLLESGDAQQISLILQLSLAALSKELSHKVGQYLLIVHAFAVLSTAAYYFLFGWVSNRIILFSQQKREVLTSRKIYLTEVIENLFSNNPLEYPQISRLLWLAFYIYFGVHIFLLLSESEQRIVNLLILSLVSASWFFLNYRYKYSWLLGQINKSATHFLQHDKLLVIILLCLGALFLCFRLGAHDFYEDEFQVIATAKGYLETTSFNQWSWVTQNITNNSYERAWPHTFLIAQSFRLFGTSEWSARLVSAISGLAFFVILYFFARFFTNRQIALISLASAVFCVSFYNIFRYARMYAMLIPLFLLFAYSLYRGLTGEWWVKTKVRIIDDILCEYLNFDYRFIIVSLILFYFNYHIHVNSLIIVLATFIFICLMALLTKTKKYIVLSLLGLTSITGVIIGYHFQLFKKFSWIFRLFTFFKRQNIGYFNYLFQHPFGASAGLLLSIVLIIKILNLKKDSETRQKYLYLMIVVSAAAIFFIFIANRYTSLLYISHVIPIAMILILAGFYFLLQKYPKLRNILLFLLVFLLISNFYFASKDFYSWAKGYGKFSSAYQTIIENYQYDEEVIFGQYLRTYYLQPLEEFKYISMRNNKKYHFSQFLEDLEKHKAGWLTWETRKSYHIEPEIRKYIDTHFLKIHGSGIDDTQVEVYYYSKPDPLPPDFK